MMEPIPEQVEAGKDSYELQQQTNEQNETSTEAPTGPHGILPDNKHEDDRPPITRDQLFLVTAATSVILFLYDGLQVRFRKNPN